MESLGYADLLDLACHSGSPGAIAVCVGVLIFQLKQ
jgi:hypothetical protein